MIKRNNGFTLVELLAVIVVLAIIAALAVSSYGKVSVSVKQKSFENLKTHIETKAEDYANDTGNLITNVDELVKKGYLEADDEAGNIKNPVDGSTLNCHIVSIVEENGNLYGQYSEEEECDLNAIKITNLNLSITMHETSDGTTRGNEVTSGNWTNKNIILEAKVTGSKINKNEIESLTWQSNAERKEVKINNNFDSQNTYVVSVEQIINTTYSVTLRLKDGTIYQASTIVKIDKQRPVIYEIQIDKEEEWTNIDKTIRVAASDGNGSGIYGYYVGTNPNCGSVSYEANSNSNYTTMKDEGTYYVCVKDKAGNIAEDTSSKKSEIQKVDKEAPKCSYSGESTTWTRDNRTISLTCQDTKSGCVNQNSITKTYSSNTRTEVWNYTIEDKAGNKTVCNKTVNIFVDKCTQTKTEYGSWGSCSRDCGGGTKTRSVTYRSTFGSNFVCKTDTDSDDCNTSSCHSSGGGGSDCPCGEYESCDPWGHYCDEWGNCWEEQTHGSTCCTC